MLTGGYAQEKRNVAVVVEKSLSGRVLATTVSRDIKSSPTGFWTLLGIAGVCLKQL